QNESFNSKYIRLIFQGKMMNPIHTIHPFYKIENGSFVHCMLSDEEYKKSNTTQYNNNRKNTTYNNNGSISQVPIGATFQGFEVLRNTGFTQEDINEVRQQFYSNRPSLWRDIRQGRIT